jgi:hypothetical protein
MIKSEKLQILKLSNKRYQLLEEYEKSWDKKSEKYIMSSEEIDSLEKEIYKKIKEWKDFLSFEFIIDELTKLGHAPNLLYDDNGNFAITGEGFQTVAFDGPCDMEMGFFVKKDKWKPTIREALDKYLR